MTPQPTWAVIFDVDGTMVDNADYHEEAWIVFGQRHGLPITHDYYREHIHARSNDLIVRQLYGEDIDATRADQIAAEKEATYRELYRPVLEPNPGLLDFLAKLRDAGLPCAAASNSPRPNVDMVLEELRIVDYFSVIVAQSPDMPGKPDPTMLLTVADGLGVAPGRCVVLEDSTSGFRAAENAGMAYVVIARGADPTCLDAATSASAVHPDFTTLSLDELARYAG